MEEKKLTDEELVKAYKYCVLDDGNCDDCPYEACGCGIDGHDIIDIIHRQKAENERLTEYNANLNGMCLEFIDKNAELQKQVDKLKKDREAIFNEMSERMKAVIEVNARSATEALSKAEQKYYNDNVDTSLSGVEFATILDENKIVKANKKMK